MGVVVECPQCHHTGLDHTQPRGNGQFKAATSICQVAVRIPMPNQPGAVMAMPCGCDGTGPATVAPEPVVAAPLAACFNPGCQEFAAPNSSFCSQTCQDEMAAMIVNLAKNKGDSNGE